MTMTPSLPQLSWFSRREVDADGTQWFIAEYLELPGCVVYSKDEEEIPGLLEAAKAAYLAHLEANGLPIPERPDVVDDVRPRFFSGPDDATAVREVGEAWRILTTGQWEAIPTTA